MSKRKSRISSFHFDSDQKLPIEMEHTTYLAAQDRVNDNKVFSIGQRWYSEMEPELGIGTIEKIEKRYIIISFHNGTNKRQYSRINTPLKRILFQNGDTIKTKNGSEFTIHKREEKNGLMHYRTHDQEIEIVETEICDSIHSLSPFRRLLDCNIDSIEDFNFRYKALQYNTKLKNSPIRGFIGGRIDLIPHQIYIADTVSRFHYRKVLLADEVGLGKTIEACLILHRLYLCGHAKRVLIMVPESMVHVWFVELLRKFNLTFRIINDKDIAEVNNQEPEENPFLDDQLFIIDLDSLSQNTRTREKVVEAGWDILIVDEVHRIRTRTNTFKLVGNIAQNSKNVIFLSATPEQNGTYDHFSRLQLLDPNRYPDYKKFLKEIDEYKKIADITGRILLNMSLSDTDKNYLKSLFKNKNIDEIMNDYLSEKYPKDSNTHKSLVLNLIDRYGIGRAMFRNTRSIIGGFPDRKVNITKLTASKNTIKEINKEFINDSAHEGLLKYNYLNDPRITFTIDLLKSLKKEKFLLICHTKEKVKEILRVLKQKVHIKIAEFHEELSLIQRDRNAAWFSEEDGARLLLCSEIGSEGRNFQFSHHLIFWDIPFNSDLIEQRIGRLDRIGQKHTIHIHIPSIQHSSYAFLITIFHEGFDIFQNTVPGSSQLFKLTSKNISDFIKNYGIQDHTSYQKFENLIQRIKETKINVGKEIKAGRDRLLEQLSFQSKEATALINIIKSTEKDLEFENFVINIFRQYGIIVEGLERHTYKLWTDTMIEESFPGLSPARPLITFDRKKALLREDMEFITADHPAIRDSLDMILGSEKGNSSFALWNTKNENILLLETIFVIECIAPEELFVDRFLPPTPVRVVIDQTRKEVTKLYNSKSFSKHLTGHKEMSLLDNSEIKHSLLPEMLKTAQSIIEKKSGTIINSAQKTMRMKLDKEINRLNELDTFNNTAKEKEILLTVTERDSLNKIIGEAKPRLDAVRLIWKRG